MISRTSCVRGFVLGALVLVACSSSDRPDRSDGVAPSVAQLQPQPVRALVAHRDARLDAPSFAWLSANDGVRFDTAAEAASATIKSIAPTFGLSDAALAAVKSWSIHDRGRGPIVAQFRQRANGIEVFRGSLSIALSRAFSPVSASGFLARSLAGAERPFTRGTLDAVNDAYLAMTGGTKTFTRADVVGDYEHFDASGLAAPARVKKVFYPTKSGVVPAYYVEIQIAHGVARSTVVSAADGSVLFSNDLTRYDAFSYRVFADEATKMPFDGPQGNVVSPHPTGKPDGFRPPWGPTNLVAIQNYPFSKNDPWLAAGATTLDGNNVRAYADLSAPDGLGGDTIPSSSAQGVFDYAYDTTKSPGATSTNIAGSVTDLFYITNFLHDWYYDIGFDEAAGNHQASNYGRGGVEHDPLKAEAQDYSGKNNANATVPSDGSSPRLQMYVFSGPSVSDLQVLAPASIAGAKSVGLASFGQDTFDTTGTVALAADDQGADVADGCEPITSNVTGKIVLVHRGLCSFIQKVQNVQAAGGIGVIIANVASSAQPTTPPFMGGTDATSSLTIPVLSLALADGQALEAAVATGVTVEMRRLPQTDLDGGIDTAIVSHEWGHVISGRLIDDGNGLTTNQSAGLGEGWADFSALLLTVRADDVLTPDGAGWMGAYPVGAYATSGQGSDFYFGIRRVPYSIDFTKDPLTLKHIANGTPLPSDVPISFGEDGSFNSELHNTGEIWASMLWECYASLLRDPRYTFAEAQDKMKHYYVASLKLTPPDPTLLEARDAVLAAAFASDQDDYHLFWEAFGRRGAGVGALGPDKDSTTNQGVVESYYVGNDVQITAEPLTDDLLSCDHDGILDEGEIGTLRITVRNAGTGALSAATATFSSKTPGVEFPNGSTVKLDPLQPFGVTALKIPTQIHGATPIVPIAIDVAVSDPSFPEGHVQQISVATRYEADEGPNTSAIDHVDTKRTAWVVGGNKLGGPDAQWTRIPAGADSEWSVPDDSVASEQTLTSPKFTIEGTTFELDYRHRWAFRTSRDGSSFFDGGVVEVSVNKGVSWHDLSSFGTVDYTTTLATGRGSVIEGQRAYGGKSAGYPDQWTNTRIDVDLKNHPSSVMLRFRAVSVGRGTPAPGWEVDDIALSGISSTPFVSFVAHEDNCDAKGPTADAGGPITVKSKDPVAIEGSGTHPTDLPLDFVWTQVAGPAVQFVSDGTPKLAFNAPDVGRETVTLTFALRADDGKLLSPAANVDVTVVPADPVGFSAGGGCMASAVRPRASTTSTALGIGALAMLLLGALARRRSRRRSPDLGV